MYYLGIRILTECFIGVVWVARWILWAVTFGRFDPR